MSELASQQESENPPGEELSEEDAGEFEDELADFEQQLSDERAEAERVRAELARLQQSFDELNSRANGEPEPDRTEPDSRANGEPEQSGSESAVVIVASGETLTEEAPEEQHWLWRKWFSK